MLLLLLASCLGGFGAAAPAPAPPPAAAPARLAKTWTVDCLGGGDFLTIQDAIAASRSGDTVEVRPCTYFGGIDLDGKTIVLRSTDGAASTVLQAVPGAAAVKLAGGEGPGTTVQGLTIVGGGGVEDGVVDVEESYLLLEDCVVTGGTGAYGVHGRSSQVVVKGTTISGNVAALGWSVYAQRGGIHLVSSTVTCDGNAVGVHATHGMFLLDDTTIGCAGAQSFWNEHAIGRIQRSRLTGEAVHEGELGNSDTTFFEDTVVDGGITAIDGPAIVRNCVVTHGDVDLQGAANDGSVIEGTALRDSVCAIRGSSKDTVIRDNAFSGVTNPVCGGGTNPIGTAGNFDGDCLHVDPAAGDWHLGAGSPCVDAGPPEADYADVDGSRNDIGVYGGPMTQGGGW